jgi:hypothetical protein
MDQTMNKRQELEQLMDVCLARYNEGDTVKPKDTINIIKILADDTLPTKKIDNLSNNWKSHKPDNVLYHLLRIIPKLFISSLHCDPPVDPDTLCPVSGHNFKTKFLSKRLQEPLDEISRLEKKLEEERDNNHFDEMMDYKNKNKELKEHNKILQDHIQRLEDKIKFKDEMLELRVSKKELEIRDKRIEELEKIINSLNQK